jgi:non-heme chloroperoxidase
VTRYINRDLSEPFYGANREGSKVSQGMRDSFWLMSMQVGMKGAFDCIRAFSETDSAARSSAYVSISLPFHG